MIYIVEAYPAGSPWYSTENIFNNKIKAYKYCKDMLSSQGADININLYEAINEYTAKRKLIKKY